MGAKKGTSYRTRAEIERIRQYYVEYGVFPENMSRHDKRNLRQAWERYSYYTRHSVKDVQNFNGYTGKPCVYVRQMEDNSFYIGRTKNLYKRYPHPYEAGQIIYFEEYENNEDTYPREYELIQEFVQLKLPVSNKVGVNELPNSPTFNPLKYIWW